MRPPAQTTIVPAGALLSTWEGHAWDGAVLLDRLAVLDRLVVRTRHSVYDIIVSSPATGDVLVRGGAYFPEFTKARLAGSTLGGSFVKVRAIHRGFRLEFTLSRQFVLTSAVQSIDIIAAARD